MTAKPRLAELHLRAFKSHLDQRVAFEPITLLIGRNGSGKSNALDALSLLSRVVEGRRIVQLEATDDSTSDLRGGLAGAVPFGEDAVEIGARVDLPGGEFLEYEIKLKPANTHGHEGEITHEQLTLHPGPGKTPRVLIRADSGEAYDDITLVQVYSGRMPKTLAFPSSSSAVVQAITKVPQDTKARKQVTQHCATFVSAIRGIFVLDPIPSQMRGYVRLGASQTRSGSATSAVIYALRKNPGAWDRLFRMLKDLVDADIASLSFAEARLPESAVTDVMIALTERLARKRRIVPANLMSDGTLRYLAIAATLLEMTRPGPETSLMQAEGAMSTLVVEELENGLFPSQAHRMLDLLRTEASTNSVQLVATTHSPALLDALEVGDHAGVVVCERGKNGFSTLSRLTEHPRYIELAAEGRIGSALARGALEKNSVAPLALADLLTG